VFIQLQAHLQQPDGEHIALPPAQHSQPQVRPVGLAPAGPPGTGATAAGGMHLVRQAMLEAMVAAGLVQPSRLSTRIRYCSDVTGLWHLRSELMQALAAAHGELHARSEIDHITELFDGHVSSSLTSRPAPLR
jgi:hypothetical protein